MKEGTGLPRNTAAALSYVLGFVSGFIILLLEKDKFVRFHAMQSIVVFGGLFAINWLLIFTVILAPLSALLWLVGFILWLVLIYKAWTGVEWEVPFAGKLARQFLGKLGS